METKAMTEDTKLADELVDGTMREWSDADMGFWLRGRAVRIARAIRLAHALRTQPNATSAREDALREAAQIAREEAEGVGADDEPGDYWIASLIERRILALIDNPTKDTGHG